MRGSRPQPAPDRDADLWAAINALQARVAVLEAQDGRRDYRAALLVIDRAAHGAAFNARDLLRRTHVDRELADVLRGLDSPKRIGRFLRRLANRLLAGLVLRRVGQDHDGVIWSVHVAPEIPGPSGVPSGERA